MNCNFDWFYKRSASKMVWQIIIIIKNTAKLQYVCIRTVLFFNALSELCSQS